MRTCSLITVVYLVSGWRAQQEGGVVGDEGILVVLGYVDSSMFDQTQEEDGRQGFDQFLSIRESATIPCNPLVQQSERVMIFRQILNHSMV